MSKLNFFVVLLLLFPLFSLGQTTQMYKGTYSDYVKGIWDCNISYPYYFNDDDQKVRHGQLTINGKVSGDMDNKSLTASCQYVHGKINGTLTENYSFSRNLNKINSRWSGYWKTNASLTAAYKNGVPDGIWKIVYKNTHPYDETVEGTFSFTYKDGTIISSTTYGKTRTYDNRGRMTGTIDEDNVTFNVENGVVTNYYKRKNGALSIIDEDIQRTIINKIMNEDTIDTVYLIDNGYFFETYSFELNLELCNKTLDGQLNISFFDPSFILPRIPIKYTIIKKIKLSSYEEVAAYYDQNFAHSFVNTEYITKYQNIGDLFMSHETAMQIKPYIEQREREKYEKKLAEYTNSFEKTLTEIGDELIRLSQENKNSILTTELWERKIETLYRSTYNGAWDYFFDSDDSDSEEEDFSSLPKEVGKKLAPFMPIMTFKIDTINVEQAKAYCTLEKRVSKGPNDFGSEYWKSELRIGTDGQVFLVDIANSFDFANAERVRGLKDVVNELQTQLAEKENIIKAKTGNLYSDVYVHYNSFKEKLLRKTDDLNVVLLGLKSVLVRQSYYMNFIEKREKITTNENRIISEAGKDYADVAKAYQAFSKSYNVSITEDSTESFNRLNTLINVQQKCIEFINLRKIVAQNNAEILAQAKTCKNIIEIYSAYFKNVDITWTSEENTQQKLQDVIANQNIFKNAVTAPNAAELDKIVKKLKDKSLESVKQAIQ